MKTHPLMKESGYINNLDQIKHFQNIIKTNVEGLQT